MYLRLVQTGTSAIVINGLWHREGADFYGDTRLTVPAAIDLHQRQGGQLLRERNALLAQEASRQLAAQWNTDRGSTDLLTGSMATVRLPLGGKITLERALNVRASLLKEHRIAVVFVRFWGFLWVRISAQAYNTLSDYQVLVEGVRKLQLSEPEMNKAHRGLFVS